MSAVTALEPITRELQQIEATMIRGLRQRLPEQLATTFYAGSARLLVAGRKPVEGPAAIVQFWYSMFNAGLIDVRLESQRVDSEHELAYCAGTFLATFETQPGILRCEHGNYLTIYRRQADGNWRALEQCLTLEAAISVP